MERFDMHPLITQVEQAGRTVGRRIGQAWLLRCAVAAVLGLGVAIAVERRAFLEKLIKTDPKAALELAVPDHVRRQLPAEVQKQLEERVSGKGFFGVLVADYPGASRREITREVLLNRRRYDAYVYGRRESQTTRERENFWGIAIGSSLAVHEEPIRALTLSESAGLDPTGRAGARAGLRE